MSHSVGPGLMGRLGRLVAIESIAYLAAVPVPSGCEGLQGRTHLLLSAWPSAQCQAPSKGVSDVCISHMW